MKFQTLMAKAAMFSAVFGALPAISFAEELAISVGAQEIYDSNVFLEDDRNIDLSAIAPGLDPEALEQVDADPNDDFITNAYIGVQGALPIPQYLKGSGSAKVGALTFADVSEQNRLTLDGALELSLADDFRPEFLTLAVGDTLQSGTTSISNAANTATRTSETNDAYLNLGLGEFALAPQTTSSFGYRLNRRDFLGEFLFDENKEIPDSTQFKERGADYFSNSIDANVKNQISQQLDAGVTLGADHTNFTKVRSDAAGEGDNPDRMDYRGSLFSNYRASEEFVFSGRVGATYSEFDDERAPRSIVFTDGSTVSVIPEDNYTSLTFLGSLTYLPQAESSLRFSVGQDVVTDVGGERTLVRTVRLDGGHEFNERIAASAGVLFSQFDNSDSLSDASDRFEFNTGLSYSLTESVALIAGYNYINQSTDGVSEQFFSLGADDYETHRAFIGINAGFVGISG